MWSGPPLEAVNAAVAGAAAGGARLIDLKAAPETLEAEVRGFARRSSRRPSGRGRWASCSALSLDWLNDERDVVIRGIKRFAVGQQALADKIVAETRELERLQRRPPADAARARAAAGGTRCGTPGSSPTARNRCTLVCDQPVAARAARLRARPPHPGTAAMNRRACWRWAWPLLAAPAWAADTVADRVFGAGLLAGVTEPSRAALPLRDERQGHRPALRQPHRRWTCARSPRTAPSRCSSTCSRAPTGAQFGPIAAREQNPLVLVFLQRDVAQMANLTGGAAGYFQQQIRRGFSEPAEVEPVEVTLGDRKLAGTRLVMHAVRQRPQHRPLPAVQGQVLRVRRGRRRAGRDLPAGQPGARPGRRAGDPAGDRDLRGGAAMSGDRLAARRWRWRWRWCSAGRTVAAAPAGYPTEALADYVLACMASNGETPDAMRRCSCSIDYIAEPAQLRRVRPGRDRAAHAAGAQRRRPHRHVPHRALGAADGRPAAPGADRGRAALLLRRPSGRPSASVDRARRDRAPVGVARGTARWSSIGVGVQQVARKAPAPGHACRAKRARSPLRSWTSRRTVV